MGLQTFLKRFETALHLYCKQVRGEVALERHFKSKDSQGRQDQRMSCRAQYSMDFAEFGRRFVALGFVV